MTKFKLYFDKDAETEWLNQMVEKGWALKSFCVGFYRFEECKKGEYIYQIDFSDKFVNVSEEYREYMQELGIEIVQIWGYWIILRKAASEGKFELYTDVESAKEHYTKIRNMFRVGLIIEVACLLVEVAAWLNGVAPAFWGIIIIGALAVSLLKAVMKVNDVINKLN